MTSYLMEIIRSLNNGSVIPGQLDEEGKVNLFSDIACLYIDESNSKYYYFANLSIGENGARENNLGQIEKVTIKNSDAYETVALPEPNSSYLILFWEVDAITEDIYPQIIQLEENEFFFKKYVFYYTIEELNAFKDWYSNMADAGRSTLPNLLDYISKEIVDFESLHISFFIRLLIKIPFWKLEFPKTVLDNVDNIVSTRINATRGSVGQKVKDLDSEISNLIKSENFTIDSVVDVIYKKMMEG